MSSNNLLTNVNDIDLDDREKIKSFEKATNDGSYKETDLLDLYTRFQFNIYQIISVSMHTNYYQIMRQERYYIKLFSFKRCRYTNNLLELLKKEFDDDNLNKAFDKELIKLIQTIDEDKISSQFYEFYEIQLSKTG